MRIIQTLLAALLLATGLAEASPDARPAQRVAADCETAQDCRIQALDAAEAGDYERFHDLAWRAVQQGPRNDPALMALLARAQSLSGRPHDALVMLQRLAAMGAATDAATSDDFRRVRALAGWADLEARLAGVPAPAGEARTAPDPPAPALPAPRVFPGLKPFASLTASPGAAVPKPEVPAAADAPPARAGAPSTPGSKATEDEEAAGGVASTLRFSTIPFQAAGLAYDSVSARFIVGHREERKLTVIGERSQRLVNLVGEDSAGFGEIEAIALDPAEGDLWVASTPDGGAPPRLHKLQLISGRLLFTASPADEASGARLADIAVAADGGVLALDAPNRRLLRVAPGSRELATIATLDAPDPVSLAPAPGGAVYVASAGGIARLDAAGRPTGALKLPEGLDPARLTWIRLHRGALLAAERAGEGLFRIVRIRLDANGRRATGLEVLEADVRLAGPATLALAGDVLFYLGRDEGYTGSGGMDVTIRRVPLGR